MESNKLINKKSKMVLIGVIALELVLMLLYGNRMDWINFGCFGILCGLFFLFLLFAVYGKRA